MGSLPPQEVGRTTSNAAPAPGIWARSHDPYLNVFDFKCCVALGVRARFWVFREVWGSRSEHLRLWWPFLCSRLIYLSFPAGKCRRVHGPTL